MCFWSRAGAAATCVYAGERWLAGMTFESVPETVWLGIAASSLLFIIIGDTIRWLHKRRRAKAKAAEAKVRAEKDEADRREAQEILRGLRARDMSLDHIKDAISDLKREPLGDSGHTYAELPDGTNIVSMADGSYRLALPVRLGPLHLGGSIEGSLKLSPEVKKSADPSSATLKRLPGDDDEQPE